MKKLAIVLFVVAAVVALASYSMAPPRRQALAPDPAVAPPLRGAIHVHTRRSDGTGTVEDVAAAAARAGLAFVVFTDHGDGTGGPDVPRYHSGVLCIDGVEISTGAGHVLALGIPQSPYPLGGEPRDVIEDIARLGGMSIAAHPGSPKPGLRWLEWTAPFDGLEWLNADSEWRDEERTDLVRTVLTYPFRRAESLAALLDRPEPILARWDALTGRRPVVAVAGADAHARVWSPEDGATNGFGAAVRAPSYEVMFRTFSTGVPGAVLTGDATEDARVILAALRGGRVFSSIDALAGPASLAFTATRGSRRASMGETMPAGGPITFDIRTNAPDGSRIVLLRNGEVLTTHEDHSLQQSTPGERGAYRVEVHLPSAPGDPPVPWLVSNPIYVRTDDETRAAPDPRGPPTEFATVYGDGPAAGARVESSARSQGTLDVVAAVAGEQLSLRYALGGTVSDSPYVALVLPAAPGLSGYDRLMFRARASVPMRLSVQLRAPQGEQGQRWHRSIYLDRSAREIVIPFDEMTPRGETAERRPPLAIIRDLLFVVDTVNTRPGSSGQIWLDDIRYAR